MILSEILRNLKQQEIEAAIENNRIEVYRDTWLQIDAEEMKKEGYSLYASNLKISLYNGVIDTNLEEVNVDKTIDEVISFFENQNLPFRWLAGVTTKPRNIFKHLEKKGFIVERNPGMAMNLNQIERKEHDALEILKVGNLDNAEKFADVAQKVYGLPKEILLPGLLKILNSEEIGCYLALLNEKPVGISTVYYFCGVAGSYLVGVLQEERKKGIGSAITSAPLYDAKELGYEWSILYSSELGFNAYKRIGFEQYCIGEVCTWNPK
jgi:hypothetical protein